MSDVFDSPVAPKSPQAAIFAVQQRDRDESRVKSQLLQLLMFKPLEQYGQFPDWSECLHVDLMLDQGKLWPETGEQEAIISNIVGGLSFKRLTPVDVCVVRHSIPGGQAFAFVVKTEAMVEEATPWITGPMNALIVPS